MDDIDRKIIEALQEDARRSHAEIGALAGLSASSAHERVKRLTASGALRAIRAIPDPAACGIGLCAFVLVDVAYAGEAAACAALVARPEVQELHHVTGARSYLLKVRVADAAALQRFLAEAVKPLDGVARTETLIALETLKETTALPLGPRRGAGDDA